MTRPVLACNQLGKKAPKADQGGIVSIDLRLPPGETVAILGMKRWERKAFIDLITGLVKPDEGRIVFQDRDFSGVREDRFDELRGRIGVVTDPPVFLNNVRMRENLRLPLRYHSALGRSAIDEKIDGLLEELEIGTFPDVIPSNFGHSFLGAAALVRALSITPELLVLERPGEVLGKAAALKLPKLWRKHVLDQGGTVLMLTTIPRLAMALCHKIALFEDGRIVSIEARDSFAKNKKAVETQWKGLEDDEK